MAREGEDGYKLCCTCVLPPGLGRQRKKTSDQAPLKDRKDKKFWEECLFVRRVRCECRKGLTG